MRNRHTGFNIAVIELAGEAMFVLVPAAQADEVRQLFQQHGIAHTLGKPLAPVAIARNGRDRHGTAVQQVIHILCAHQRQRVQQILDRAR
jgi:hypothetical protein